MANMGPRSGKHWIKPGRTPRGPAKGGKSQHTKCYAVIDKRAGISYVSTSDGKFRGIRLLDGEDRGSRRQAARAALNR